MKKALIIGGANGIGLALSKQLIKKGYRIIVLDVVEPQEIDCEYYKFNLLDIDTEILEKLSQDELIEVLFITADIGRICSFEHLHFAEINKIMNINAVSALEIIRYFYPRIKSNKNIYVGMMGSIAGMVSSPLFSVYGASKAVISKFIESINVELEKSNTQNRILNVSLGDIKGTSFYGEKTNTNILIDLSNEILKKLFSRVTIYIPNYEEVYKKVIDDYTDNPHNFGLQSYDYKINNGRVDNSKRVKIGYMSGTFDLFHIGHLNVIKHAKENCDYLIVGVHKDASHKGKETFIPFEERMAIVRACKYVDKVVESSKEDSDDVFKYGANLLFVGSDYKGTDRFNKYEELFSGKDIKIMYFPYTKSTSSTQIRDKILKTK